MGFQVAHLLGIPIFTMAFVLLYNPFNLQEVLEYNRTSFTFNISISLAITTLVYLICRLIFFFTRTVRQTGWLQYFTWVFLEVMVTCCFIALFLSLVKQDSNSHYFSILLNTIGYFLSIVIFPYFIITTIFFMI